MYMHVHTHTHTASVPIACVYRGWYYTDIVSVLTEILPVCTGYCSQIKNVFKCLFYPVVIHSAVMVKAYYNFRHIFYTLCYIELDSQDFKNLALQFFFNALFKFCVFTT